MGRCMMLTEGKNNDRRTWSADSMPSIIQRIRWAAVGRWSCVGLMIFGQDVTLFFLGLIGLMVLWDVE